MQTWPSKRYIAFEIKPNKLVATLIPCLDLFFLGANWKTKVGPLFFAILMEIEGKKSWWHPEYFTQ